MCIRDSFCLAAVLSSVSFLATILTRRAPGMTFARLPLTVWSVSYTHLDPEATWELVCHPGYPDSHLDQVRTRLRASRTQEHAALLKLLPAISLASWRDLESSAAVNQLH